MKARGFGKAIDMYSSGTPGIESDNVKVRASDKAEVRIDNAELMFLGDYSRDGDSLIIEYSDQAVGNERIVFDDFFASGQPDLVAPNGGRISYKTVEALAGPENPAKYANTEETASGLEKIGEVIKLEGSANAR